MKYLILGGGPAGLTVAHQLLKRGEESVLILEAESDAGGLCRSRKVDGYSLDIGGGHFLDVKRPQVNDFLFSFLPEKEWEHFERDSRIEVHGYMVGHPFESNIWQLPINDQVEYIKSIAYAGCNQGEPMPTDFVRWITWKLGKLIAENYMLPYNRKMFGSYFNILGTDWLEKLPNVSIDETLLSCLTRHAYGTQSGHAQFLYPKNYGYGEVWRRMADALGSHILYRQRVKKINFENLSVKTSTGDNYSADQIITTIPWGEFEDILGMPKKLKNIIADLKHTSIAVQYYSKQLNTRAHWIYYPDENLTYHRILVRHNFSQGSGYWTETNIERLPEGINREEECFINNYAYPLNTIGKNEKMKKFLAWCSENGVYGLGRWGEHQHYNSDITVEKAIQLANVLSARQ